MTFKSLVAILMLALGSQVSVAQTPFWTETFDAGTWTHGGTNPGAEVWTWTTNLMAGFNGFPAFGAPTGATGYYYFNSDANGAGAPHDVTLTGLIASVDGKEVLRVTKTSKDEIALGQDVANELLGRGGREILASVDV